MRVAITGVGIVSPFGHGKEAALSALRNGSSGIRRLENFDPIELNCRIGGEVPPEPPGVEALFGPAPAAKYDRFTILALRAADEATAQAAIQPGDVEPERLGAIIGTGLGGCETLDAGFKRIYAEKQSRVAPTTIPWSMYNAAASAIATKWRARGPAYAVVSACASSAHAIGQAYQAIAAGQADAILAGGADAPLTFGTIRAWESMRVLAVNNEFPDTACRPFDADRKGLVLAEGAAVLVLESFTSAMSRGATILGEVTGFGITSDAGHLTDPSADGAARAMRMALGNIDPAAIGYINAHGTATRANDITETKAIKLVFGDAARRIPVSSTKSMHGHAMGASGAIEIAASLLALNDGFLPPTINLKTRDPECDLDYIPLVARDARAGMFLSNSFGFGGMNGVVAVRTLHGL